MAWEIPIKTKESVSHRSHPGNSTMFLYVISSMIHADLLT